MTGLVTVAGMITLTIGLGLLLVCVIMAMPGRFDHWQTKRRVRRIRQRQLRQATVELTQLMTQARSAMFQQARQVPQRPEVWDA